MSHSFKKQVAGKTRPSASDLNALADLARAFAAMQAAAPIVLQKSETGSFNFSFNENALTVFRVALAGKVTCDTRPDLDLPFPAFIGGPPDIDLNGLQYVFPAYLQPNTQFDRDTPTHRFNKGFKAQPIWVYNLAECYVTDGAPLLVFKVMGQWYTYHTRYYAEKIKFEANAAFGSGDATIQVTIRRADLGIWPKMTAPDTNSDFKIYNELGFSGDTGSMGYAYRGADGKYYIENVQCPATAGGA